MQEINFQHLVSDECVFVREKVIFVAYVEEIFLSPHPHLIDEAIRDLISVGLKIEDQGLPADYAGVNIKHNNDGSILLLQPMLIQSILKEVGLGPRMMMKLVPVPSQKLFQSYLVLKVFNNCFHYWSIIGKLNYLAMLTHLDIQLAVHSCTRYSTCPKQEHGEAVK